VRSVVEVKIPRAMQSRSMRANQLSQLTLYRDLIDRKTGDPQ
jgi:hypothetical protein